MKFVPAVAAAVVAVAVAAAPAAGAGLPDLRPASVSSTAAEVPQGATLDVRAVVRNRGAGRAKASVVGWWLSRDGRARDVRLGTAPAKALGTGRRHRVATRLRVTAAPGRYRLLACADAGRRVGERSERNNCMPARGTVSVVAGTPSPAPLPPVGDPTPPAPPAPPAPPKPDPEIPPLDRGAATSLADSVAFLHSGANPIQQGVAPGTIRERRAAALRGTVTDRAGAPLPGVRITVVGHPEYGRTDTQADGGFQLVVNGGDAVTIAFAKAGYADVQRTVETPWEDWVIVDSVVMIPLDPSVTRIVRDSDEPFQVARATPSRDADGSRRATLLFPRGVAATMRMPDGERRPLGDLSVRATEYTVGNAGDAAMPGTLPPSSGYTYAAAFTVDEAERAGAASVEFDKPVLSYTENFIGAEVGSAVPAGYYDPRRTEWVPAPNGRVVEILSETDGLAAVGGAAGLDISDDERGVLARLYEPGQDLWRVPLEHFTPWDLNWPYGPPPGAMPPLPWFNGEAPDPCEETGSIIGCETQTLGERVPVTGTPFDLVYSSDRQPGWRAGERIRIPITAGEMPDRLKGVQLTIDIAGRRFEQRWEDPTNPIQGQTALPDLEPNLSYTFTWDGKDAFGRPVQGSPIATIRVVGVYDFVYYPSKSGVASSFGQFPDDMEYFDGRRSCGNQRPSFVRGVAAIAGGGGLAVQDPATDPHFFCGVPVARTVKRSIGAWNAAGVGLGGWTLSVHHAYDPVERKLHKGDGSTASTAATGFASRLIAGGGGAWPDAQPDPFPATGADLDSLVEAALGPDGSIYVTSGPCSNGGHGGVRRITPDGMISQFAGRPQCGEPTGDGGPARDAVLGHTLRGLDVGPDGSVYLSVVGTVFPNGYIRKIAPDGTISTLAGVRCACGPIGDGGPAVAARVTDPVDVKVGPDGSVYFGERPGPVNGNKARIRRIDPTGVIQTIAGGGIDANPDEDLGTGEPATDHNLALPYSMAFGPDGSLFVAHPTKHVVTRIGTDGRITRVAGADQQGTNGPDGRPALETALGNPTDVAVDSAGALFIRTDDFGDGSESLIRKLLPDGTITTVAGRREGGCSFTLSPPSESATYACIERTSRALEVAPNGSIVYTDGRHQLRRLESALPGFTNGGMYIPSDDGGELYALDSAGRHLRTVDSLTGALRWRFEYDGARRLSAVVDGDGDATRIERDGAGRPVAIVGPRGQRTTLVPDGAGRLGSIADPAGNAWRMGYDGGGLLKTFQDPRGGVSRMDYDGSGRLVRDANPEEGTKTLTRTETDSGVKVEVTTRLGRTTTYRDELLPGGARRRSVRTPSGAESVIVLRENGSRSLTRADGTTVASEAGADPRFGMALPTMARQVVTTPDGHRRELTTRLDAQLDDTSNPLSVSSLTEEVKVGDKAWTRDWTRATRTMRVETPEGRRREIRFDEKGRVVYDRSDTRVEPMRVDYDEHGRVTRVTRGDRFVALTYAADSDRPATRRDASGREWAYAYDAAERLVGIRMPSGARYGFGYDPAGALTSVTMPNGAVHRIGRNGLGRETSYTPPGGAPFTTELDYDGAMALARLPGGRTIDPDRDAAGRLERVVFPEAATGVEYDGAGRATAITRAPGPRLELGYDGQLIERMATDAGAFAWTFDDMLRPTGRTLMSGGDTITTAFEYDGDSLPRKVGPFAIDRTGPGGAATALRDGTVLAQGWTYDTLGRQDVRTQTVAGRAAYKLDLGYDNAGRIVTREETVDGVKRTYAYGYDLDGRLTEVRRDGAVVERYGYDSNGNRTSARYGDDPAQAATYDGQDRLMSRAGIAHTPDADGFTVARGSDAFTYSAAGELLSASVGDRTVTYAYDALGRRVARTEGGATERYLYGNPDDRFQVSAVRSPGGALSVLHHDDSGVLFAIERGGRRFYVGADQVGTPRVVTDDSGAVVKRLEYDTFGRLLADSAPEWELPIGFAGGIADRVTGLVRFGMRDYDTAAGRWTARDPIRFAGGQGNLYAYAGSDPVNYRDTNGMNRRCDCPIQTSLNELSDGLGHLAAAGGAAAGFVGSELAGYTAASDAIFSLTVDRGMISAVKTLSVRGVQGLGNGMVAAEIASAEATVAAEMAAAQSARTAAMAAGAKVTGSFLAGVAAGLAFNRWWDCTYGKSFGESVYDWAARRGWVPE